MKKQLLTLITGIIIGALAFGSIALAAELVVAPSTQGVYVDGTPVSVEAYNINGANYFKARDFAAAMDVGMWYDEVARSIMIETDKAYDAAYTGPGGQPTGQASIPTTAQPATTQVPVTEPPASQPVKSSGTYVGSVISDKYHVTSCRSVKTILPENEIWFDTIEEALSLGYSPCGFCGK